MSYQETWPDEAVASTECTASEMLIPNNEVCADTDDVLISFDQTCASQESHAQSHFSLEADFVPEEREISYNTAALCVAHLSTSDNKCNEQPDESAYFSVEMKYPKSEECEVPADVSQSDHEPDCAEQTINPGANVGPPLDAANFHIATVMDESDVQTTISDEEGQQADSKNGSNNDELLRNDDIMILFDTGDGDGEIRTVISCDKSADICRRITDGHDPALPSVSLSINSDVQHILPLASEALMGSSDQRSSSVHMSSGSSTSDNTAEDAFFGSEFRQEKDVLKVIIIIIIFRNKTMET
jgi:hypothetical protein